MSLKSKIRKFLLTKKRVKAVKNFEMKKGKGNLIEISLTFDSVPKYE